MPTMIRNLHLLFGFLSIPFILVYAISAVFFVHPTLDRSSHSTVMHEPVAAIDGSRHKHVITEFIEANNIRGEIISEENHRDDSSLITIKHPGKKYKIRYYPAQNRIELEETTKNLTGLLKDLHLTSGFDNAETAANVWGIYIFIEALLLLLIVISGIWLWLQRSRDRNSGLLFLLTSLMTGVVIMTVIRLG